MTIGLIILGVIAVAVFFGAAERFFRKIGVPNWSAFLLVLALVAGAVVPEIRIGSFTMNLGGFAVPAVIAVISAVLIGWDGELFRSGIALLAAASAYTAVRMLIVPDTTAMTITASVVGGFLVGAVAYLISGSRLGTALAATGGTVIGDLLVSLVYRFFIDGSGVSLGTRGAFDSMVIALVFGLLLSEVIGSIRSAYRRDAAFEAGEELFPAAPKSNFNEEDFEDWFSDEEENDK